MSTIGSNRGSNADHGYKYAARMFNQPLEGFRATTTGSCSIRLLYIHAFLLCSGPVRVHTHIQFLTNQMQQGNAPLDYAVICTQWHKGGHILWEQGFGWADREKRIPAAANTMYSLASISKPLTATALMTLVAAGKIDLDKTVNDYLGYAKIRARIGNADDATGFRRVAKPFVRPARTRSVLLSQ